MYSNEKYDIIILAGQSNAEGFGLGDLKHKFNPKNKIFILEDKNRKSIFFDEKGLLRVDKQFDPNIILAKEYENENGEKLGNFSLTFAEEYLKKGFLKSGRKLLIVYSAIGGTGFAKCEWGKTAVLQERMFDMVDYATSLNKDNRVVAFLWHQGECDAFENEDLSLKTKEKYYYEKFSYLVKQVKSKYSADIPVIAGGFVSEWRLSGFEKQCETINKATKKVLKEQGGLFVETKDLLSNNEVVNNGDNIHFSKKSLYCLGRRYFNAYKKIVNNKKQIIT